MVYTTKSAKTGCIPEPDAPDGLVRSSSVFCVCMPYTRTGVLAYVLGN